MTSSRDAKRAVRTGGATLAFVIALAAALFAAAPAIAAGTLSVSWSPSSPTASGPVTITGTVTGCGNGNTSTPSLYYLVTGPGGYYANSYISSVALSDNGDTASGSVSLGTLASGSYSVEFYGRGVPCFASSSNFTSTTETMVVGAPATAPATPTSLLAQANSDGSVGLGWTAPADNGATITGYTITSTPACSGCTGLSVSGNPAATTATISGLSTGTSYTFAVTATNSAGTSSASTASNPVTPATAPGAPTGLLASANPDGSVALSWTAPADNGATITGYTITPTPACSGCTGLSVSGNPAATTATISGLATGTSYAFTVTAINSVGTGNASGASNSVTPSTATSTTVTASAETLSFGQMLAFTATVTPAPSGGTVAFTDNGQPITGCTAQPVDPATGTATCETSYVTSGVQTIMASFSGAVALTGSSSPPLAIDVADPPTPALPSGVAPIPTGASTGGSFSAQLASISSFTDPYLINEHDIAGLVECAGTSQCTITLAAEVRLDPGRVVHLPSTTAQIRGDEARIVRVRDDRQIRQRIRGYLRHHPHRHLTIVVTLTFTALSGKPQTLTYKLPLRTLSGLR